MVYEIFEFSKTTAIEQRATGRFDVCQQNLTHSHQNLSFGHHLIRKLEFKLSACFSSKPLGFYLVKEGDSDTCIEKPATKK